MKILAGHWTINLGRQNGRLLHWPVSQSCAVAKTGKFWQATGQSDLANRMLHWPKWNCVSTKTNSGQPFVRQVCVSVMWTFHESMWEPFCSVAVRSFSWFLSLPRDRSLPAQPISTRKAQSRKKAHKPLRTSWISTIVSAMFANHTILLFWL